MSKYVIEYKQDEDWLVDRQAGEFDTEEDANTMRAFLLSRVPSAPFVSDDPNVKSVPGWAGDDIRVVELEDVDPQE